MKRHILLLMIAGLSLVCFSLFWHADSGTEPVQGQPNRPVAPDFALKGLDGTLVHLSDYKGQIRIVDFWATWCPPCRAEIPHFNALAEKYGKQGVTIIGISQDQGGVAAVRSFAKSHKIVYTLVMGDLETVREYGNIQSIPTTFVIDQKGRIFSKHEGYRPQEVFEQEIQQLLKETDDPSLVLAL